MAGTPTVYTSNQWRIQLSFPNGELVMDTVSWDKATGGDITPANEKYNPGGMGAQVAVGGLRTREDLTIERAWSDALIQSFVALDNQSGSARVAVGLTPMKADRKTANGNTITYTGLLGKVTRPDSDSSTSKVDTLKVVVTCDEQITGGGQ
jgi:hypothetical protein